MNRFFALCLIAVSACLLLRIPAPSDAQTGSASEPVRYVGGIYVDLDRHDGRLRPAIGVENRQVMRANRAHPELGDGFGWTYNHAPMLAYWNGKFYLEYLSNPVGEHRPPRTDGRRHLDRRPELEYASGRLPSLPGAGRDRAPA